MAATVRYIRHYAIRFLQWFYRVYYSPNKRIHILPSAFVWLLVTVSQTASATNSFHQMDSTRAGRISLSAKIEQSETPLNVPVKITIILSWDGTADRYRIGPFNAPRLINLTVTGSTSTSRSEVLNGKPHTVKEYTFLLKPVELGMGYVETMEIDYTDNLSGVKDTLPIQRMGIKGLLPVAEKKSGKYWLVFLFLIIAAGGSGGAYWHWRKKKSAKKPIEPQPIPLETLILDQLKAIQRKTTFSFKQKLDETYNQFRTYIIQHCSVPEGGRTDKEIIAILTESGSDENLLNQIRTIFEQAEQLRFSGSEITESQFESIYSAIISFIEKRALQENKTVMDKS